MAKVDLAGGQFSPEERDVRERGDVPRLTNVIDGRS
jgi:hypothetical protein